MKKIIITSIVITAGAAVLAKSNLNYNFFSLYLFCFYESALYSSSVPCNKRSIQQNQGFFRIPFIISIFSQPKSTEYIYRSFFSITHTDFIFPHNKLSLNGNIYMSR